MLYMVVERFKESAVPKIYQRLRERGRMMPDGLEYVSSWIDSDYRICFQLMRTNDQSHFKQWTVHWDDLMEFEITRVQTSAEVVAALSESSAMPGQE